jgi:hypothetical protein
MYLFLVGARLTFIRRLRGRGSLPGDRLEEIQAIVNAGATGSWLPSIYDDIPVVFNINILYCGVYS